MANAKDDVNTNIVWWCWHIFIFQMFYKQNLFLLWKWAVHNGFSLSYPWVTNQILVFIGRCCLCRPNLASWFISCVLSRLQSSRQSFWLVLCVLYKIFKRINLSLALMTNPIWCVICWNLEYEKHTRIVYNDYQSSLSMNKNCTKIAKIASLHESCMSK